MNRIFKFFIDNWRFSFLITVLTVIVGAVSLDILRKESFPPVNFAVVSVSTIYPGATPEEVQDKVTREIEAELRGIDGIKRVRSTSRSETSEIVIEIDIDNTDTQVVVSDIQKAVQRAKGQLPTEILEEPRVLEVKAEEIPVYEFALIGPNQDRKRDKLAEQIEDRLDDVPGVLDARLSGQSQKELQISVNPTKLRQNQLSLTEIVATLSAQIKNTPSGLVDDSEKISYVRVVGKQTDPENLEKIALRTNDFNQSVVVGDIAQVKYSYNRPNVIARVDNQEATLIVVTKKGRSDTIELVNNVKTQIEKIKTTLPEGYQIVVHNDEGMRVENRLNIVNFNALSGIIIVLIVLFLFLPGKVGLFSAMSLPICALGTVAFMIWQGAQFNVITMIALVICLGNLVDNSVVISEYYSQLRENGEEAKKAALKSAKQFWIPFTASTITIISAFLPMLVTQGVMGQFIRWIPIIVTIALVLSLVESVTLLPARLQFLNPKPKDNTKPEVSGWYEKLELKFANLISLTLNHKWKTVSLIFTFVFSGFLVNGMFNRFELFPAEGVEYYVSRFQAPPGTSIYKTDQMAKQLTEEILKQMPQEALDRIVTRVGVSQTDPSDPKSQFGENVGVSIIGIKPDWAAELNVIETMTKLRSIPKIQGFEKQTFEPIEGGPPVGKPLTLNLRSNDYPSLSKYAAEVLSHVEKIDGVVDPDTNENLTGQEYRFVPDSKKISFANVNNNELSLALSTALNGTPVATFNENGRKFDVITVFDSNFARNIDFLKSMTVRNISGQYVPITSLGSFVAAEAPKTQRNFDYQRAITITSDIDVNKISALELSSKVREFTETKKSSYPNVSAVFGGEEESTNESLQSLALALFIALFGIFATLVFTFKSFLKPFIILSTIPLGLVGVFYAFTIGQRPLSFLAFIGIVGLTGVVINSSIILVDYIEELRRTKPDMNLKALLVQASRQRLRAVLATGITTVVGLLPSAFGLGGYDSVLVPVTLALSWGMMIGTILTLIWIPSFYLVLFERKSA
jgi:multidrug efflux pump subunit AcrB